MTGERAGVSEIGEFEGEDGQVVFGFVVGETVEGGLGAGDVACAEEEGVGLGVGEELFDGFEALWGLVGVWGLGWGRY